MDLSQFFEGLWLATIDAAVLLLQYLGWGMAFEAAYRFWADVLFGDRADD